MPSTAPISASRSEDPHRHRYLRPPRPIHFPTSEEQPETNRHLELRTALYLFLKRELAARATIGSSQFVYYDPTTAQKRLAPDAFAKLGIPHSPIPLWKTWRTGAPELAVEIVDDLEEEIGSDEDDETWKGEEAWETKLERYRAAGVGEIVRFDPDDAEQPIRVWDHVDGDLVERVQPEDGVFECACLSLFWVAVPHPLFVRMLRLARDRAGRDLLLTPEEAERAEARARQEEARARQEAVRAQQEAVRARQQEARARAEAEEARARAEAEVLELRRLLEARTSGSTGRKSAKATKTAKRRTR
jgi:hypothetical protein